MKSWNANVERKTNKYHVNDLYEYKKCGIEKNPVN